MTSNIPIIALDIDGVFSPILKDEDLDNEKYYRWDLNNQVRPRKSSIKNVHEACLAKESLKQTERLFT